jgi:hypothetical protein
MPEKIPTNLWTRRFPSFLILGLLGILIYVVYTSIATPCPRYIQQEILAPELRVAGINFVARNVGFRCRSGQMDSLKLVRFVNGSEMDSTTIATLPYFEFRWLAPRELRFCSRHLEEINEGIIRRTIQWHEVTVTLRLNMYPDAAPDFEKACYSDP